jgi:hypothetical protein
MKWRTNKRKTTFTFGFKLWRTRRDTNKKEHRMFLHKKYPTPRQTESNGRGASDLYERKCKHFKDNPTRE